MRQKKFAAAVVAVAAEVGAINTMCVPAKIKVEE